METLSKKILGERDGAVTLHEYQSANLRCLISPSGQELTKNHPEIFGLLRQYREEFERPQPKAHVRRMIAPGNEGIIYSLMDPQGHSDLRLAVKEYQVPFVQTHPLMPVEKQLPFLHETLTRAEHLKQFCDQLAPPHLKVPEHYAFLYLPIDDGANVKECLLFMRYVDGVPLDSFLTDPAASADLFGADALAVQDSAREDFATFVQQVETQAPAFSGHPLAPDLFERNVLIDPFSPTEERPYTLWLIDQ